MNQDSNFNTDPGEKKSYTKLIILMCFMAFLYINLLAGGVITVALGSVLVRYITGH